MYNNTYSLIILGTMIQNGISKKQSAPWKTTFI